MKVLIRVDSSTEIGSGHVIRCINLAKKLMNDGAQVWFMCQKKRGNLNSIVLKYKFHLLELPSIEDSTKDSGKDSSRLYRKWLGVSQKKDSMNAIRLIKGLDFDWLIVDHYGIDHEWEKILRPYVKKIMVIDDLANRRHDCDILIDQNWFCSMESRYLGLVPNHCSKYLGPQYALIDLSFKKFRKSKKSYSRKVKKIFLFFGGGDPLNLTERFLKILLNPILKSFKVDVVVGKGYEHIKSLEKLIAKRPLTKLYIQTSNIAKIMIKTDLAIGSYGVNTWERMCLRIPSLTVSFSKNQKLNTTDLLKKDLIDFLGFHLDIDDDYIFKSILNKINNINMGFENTSSFKLVDGNGVNRVANALLGY